jgi:hypothetical protein
MLNLLQAESALSLVQERGDRPRDPPTGINIFAAYAIASRDGLILEMESAAHHTLHLPMTFEILGEGLRLFEGRALRDLATFRRRCRDTLVTCLDSFLKHPGPSSIWIRSDCKDNCKKNRSHFVLPQWLIRFLRSIQDDLASQLFTGTLDICSKTRTAYIEALQGHASCASCRSVFYKKGLTYYANLETKLANRHEIVEMRYIPSTFQVP